jgi:hypothetical protein
MHDGPGTDRPGDGGLGSIGDSGNNDSDIYGGWGSDPDPADIGAALGNNEAARDGINKDGSGPSWGGGTFNSSDNASSGPGRYVYDGQGGWIEAHTVADAVGEYYDDALDKFGEQALMRAIELHGLNMEQVQDYGQNSLSEYGRFATTVLSIAVNPLSMFSAAAQFTKLFSNDINAVHLASEIDNYGSMGSKVGSAIAAYSGLGPAFSMFAIGAGFTVGSMYAEYSVAEDLKRAGIEPISPREIEVRTLDDMLSMGNSENGGSNSFVNEQLSAGTASDQEAGFTLSPSYTNSAEKLLANAYLLPAFNTKSLMHSKNVLTNFHYANSSIEIQGYDYDGLFGADILSSVVSAGGMFLFVKAFESKGRLF